MFFSKSSKNNESSNEWIDLTSIEQLEDAIRESSVKPVAIFKHSTRCGVSLTVNRMLEREWDLKPETISFYKLDLLRYRNVSNAIADQLGVQHESPQLIVIQDGKVVFHDSHYGIGVAPVKQATGLAS